MLSAVGRVEVGQLTFKEWGWVEVRQFAFRMWSCSGGQTSAFRGWGSMEVEFQLPGAGTRLKARLQPSCLVAFGPGTLTNTAHSRYHQVVAILIHLKAVRFTEMVSAHSLDAMRV